MVVLYCFVVICDVVVDIGDCIVEIVVIGDFVVVVNSVVVFVGVFVIVVVGGVGVVVFGIVVGVVVGVLEVSVVVVDFVFNVDEGIKVDEGKLRFLLYLRVRMILLIFKNIIYMINLMFYFVSNM